MTWSFRVIFGSPQSQSGLVEQRYTNYLRRFMESLLEAIGPFWYSNSLRELQDWHAAIAIVVARM